MRVLAITCLVLGWGAATRAQGVGLAWIEPEIGGTATLVAGEPIFARVRLPVALTPPPGVQQPRALEHWSATLVGRAWSVDAARETMTISYSLPVTDVRPDTVASLVYRARIEVPAWAAPGTYALALATPGGVLRDARVELISRGGRSAIASETQTAALGTAGAHAKSLGAANGVQVRRANDALHLTVDPAHAVPVRVAIGVSGVRPVVVRGARVEWHPATSALAGSGRAVVGVAWVAPGATLVAHYGAERGGAPVLRLPAGAVPAGSRESLEVVGAGSGARVAWEVGGRAVGWSDRPHAHVFARGGRERVRALVVAPDGASTPLTGTVAVRAAGQAGCAAAAVGARTRARTAAPALVVIALLKTRRRFAFGNRVGRDFR